MKTRINSADRRRIVLSANIRPAVGINTVNVLSDARRTGNRVVSQLNAVLARRASFHVGNSLPAILKRQAV